MPTFDNTEEKYIKKVINDVVRMPQIGVVKKVTEHTSTSDFSNFEVDVLLRDEEQQRRNVPVATSATDMIAVPQESDMAIITFLDEDGDSEFPVVTNILPTDQNRAPLGEEGMIRLKRGNLYFEVHPSGDWIRMSKKSADDGSPTSQIELDSNGDITINAEGDVFIEGIDFDDHTHVAPDGGGTTSGPS